MAKKPEQHHLVNEAAVHAAPIAASPASAAVPGASAADGDRDPLADQLDAVLEAAEIFIRLYAEDAERTARIVSKAHLLRCSSILDKLFGGRHG